MATKNDLYAWSDIRTTAERDKADPNTILSVNVVKRGDKVDQSQFTDDQLAELVESGVVRSQQFPDMGSFQGSPVEWFRDQARKAAQGVLGDADTSDEVAQAAMQANLAATGAAGVEPGTGPSPDATPAK